MSFFFEKFSVKLSLSAVLGVLATAGFAPYFLWPLTLIAFAGLLWLAADTQRTRGAALLGFVFGLFHFVSGTYWTFISTHYYGNAPWWLAALLTLLLCSWMAVFPTIWLAFCRHFNLAKNSLGWFAVPAGFVLVELLRDILLTGFPWLSLGYIATEIPYLNNIAPLLGVYGLSGALVFSAYVAMRFFAGGKKEKLIGIAAFLITCLTVFLPAPHEWTWDSGRSMSVSVIQGNFDMNEKWEPENRNEALRRYRDMTIAELPSDIVLWPEAAVTYTYEQLAPTYLKDLGRQAKANDSTVIIGIVSQDQEARPFNTLIALGANKGRYEKQHLVPFGEFFPVPDWLRRWMDRLGTPYSDFMRGAPDQTGIAVKGNKLSLSICFESLFPDEFRKNARGKSMLLTVTNDAWFGNSSAPHQHLQISRMRAMENGMWLVRAANTGISAIISPDGDVRAQTPLFEVASLRESVPVNGGSTPYQRWGDWPLWFFSVLATGLTVLCLRRKQIKPV